MGGFGLVKVRLFVFLCWLLIFLLFFCWFWLDSIGSLLVCYLVKISIVDVLLGNICIRFLVIFFFRWIWWFVLVCLLVGDGGYKFFNFCKRSGKVCFIWLISWRIVGLICFFIKFFFLICFLILVYCCCWFSILSIIKLGFRWCISLYILV